MSFIIPTPPKAPKVPSLGDQQIEEARRRQRIAAANASGAESTVLTGGSGVEGAAPVAGKTLLGQ